MLVSSAQFVHLDKASTKKFFQGIAGSAPLSTKKLPCILLRMDTWQFFHQTALLLGKHQLFTLNSHLLPKHIMHTIYHRYSMEVLDCSAFTGSKSLSCLQTIFQAVPVVPRSASSFVRMPGMVVHIGFHLPPLGGRNVTNNSLTSGHMIHGNSLFSP